MQTNPYCLSAQVKRVDNKLIDVPLVRNIELNEGNNRSAHLNKMYFVNRNYRWRILNYLRLFCFTNTYRMDIKGAFFLKIWMATFCQLIGLMWPVLFGLPLIFLILLKNILFSTLVVANILNIILSISVHEACHLYFMRKFTSCRDCGTLVFRGHTIFTLFPAIKIRPWQKAIVAIFPACICILIGIIIFSFKDIADLLLLKLIFICFSFPWLLNIVNFFPWATDAKQFYKAIKALSKGKTG